MPTAVSAEIVEATRLAMQEARKRPLTLETAILRNLNLPVMEAHRIARKARLPNRPEWVQELVAEREEHRAALPWRSLWMGPPPRAYEVHLFRSADGGYQLLDRWGEPAGRRWLGDAAREVASEETVVAHLVRLGPRRIVLHLPDETPVKAAVRAAFPGRVHACHGCPRCLLARTGQEVPSPSR